MELFRTKSERTYPKCQYFRNWGLFWYRNGNNTLNTDWDAWLREWGDVFRNCTGYEAVRFVIDCIMSNKCWKLISFHFPTRLNVLWLCKYFLTEIQTETVFTYFSVQFCVLTSASYSTSDYSSLKHTWSFLVVCVILCSSIKGFAMPNCRLFHTIEKNILITLKNWWSLTYGQVLCLDLLKVRCECQVFFYLIG